MDEEKKKVSVIIAHYNAGKYINQGLESLVNQTLNQDDFEVIIVDDKSTDPLDNIKKYEYKIKNFKILVEKENHGYPSIPRNHGIDIATGQYIMLMDQDDYLSTDALKSLTAYADENKSDVIIGKYAAGEGYNGTQVPFKKGNIKEVNPCTDHVVSVLAPHKLYRKSMLNKYNIRFYSNDYVPVAEDQVFNMRAYAASRNISILADKDYYYWKQREDFGNLGKSNSYAYDEPWKYLNVIREIFLAIEKSQIWTFDQKQRIKAIYLGRIFNSNGSVMKTIALQKTNSKKHELVHGLKVIIDKYMTNENIWDVRQVCQFIVIGIKLGMTFSELKDFKKILYSTNFEDDIEIYDGKTVRNMILRGKKCKIPIDFLNHEQIRMLNINYIHSNRVNLTISVLNDLNLSSPDKIQLILIDRATKEEYISIISPEKVKDNIFLISFDYKDFSHTNIFKDGVFDFFIEVQRDSKINRYRLGNDKNKLLSLGNTIDYEDKIFKFYYTASFSNLSLQVLNN